MTPLDLLFSALAFLAAVFGLWLACCFIVVALAVWKPRGKMSKRAESVRIKMDRDPKVRS